MFHNIEYATGNQAGTGNRARVRVRPPRTGPSYYTRYMVASLRHATLDGQRPYDRGLIYKFRIQIEIKVSFVISNVHTLAPTQFQGHQRPPQRYLKVACHSRRAVALCLLD